MHTYNDIQHFSFIFHKFLHLKTDDAFLIGTGLERAGFTEPMLDLLGRFTGSGRWAHLQK